MIWIGAIASLLAVWVEAVVAAPIWAFAHLDTDGEGMGQRAQTGYLFILNVLFRPILMVIGFLLASMIVEIMTGMVMDVYPKIMLNASADSWVGLIKMFGYISVFVIILQMLVNVSFQSIRYVPDQVLGWAGGNLTNQVGAQSADEVSGASQNAMVMRGTVGRGGSISSELQASQQRANDATRQATANSQHEAQMGGLSEQNALLRQMAEGMQDKGGGGNGKAGSKI